MSPEAPNFEAMFVQHLPVLERVVATFGRRYGMTSEEVAEVTSSVKLRMIEDDYAVFRKYRGESSLPTYLTVAVTMMAREIRVQEKGRWRPSAAAQRHGPVAIHLEGLVHQKGYPLDEAGAVMRSRGITDLSDRHLGDLLRQLPRREPLRPVAVGAEPLRGALADTTADETVLSQERGATRNSVEQSLDSALRSFSLEDRLLLKLRFWQEASIADAARILGVDQRPLYRRIEKLLGQLRDRLTSEGVTIEQVRDMIGEAR